MKNCFIPIFFISTVYNLIISSTTGAIIDLGGSDWIVTNGTSKTKATVPGQIHTDLLAAEIIDEPYNGFNVDTTRWIPLSQWMYSKTFEVSKDIMSNNVIQLYSLGLDTIGTLAINGENVLSFNNMFRHHRLNIKQYLKVGTNTIDVHFASKPLVANETFHQCKIETSEICPSHILGPAFDGFNQVSFIRTEPCSFAWDWGPAFSPVGIWRELYIDAYNYAVVRDVTVVTTPVETVREENSTSIDDDSHFISPLSFHPKATKQERKMIEKAFQPSVSAKNKTPWKATFTVFIDAGISSSISTIHNGPSSTKNTVIGMVKVTMHNGLIGTSSEITLMEGEEKKVIVEIVCNTCDLWYPNGYGKQSLYTATAEFINKGEKGIPNLEKRIYEKTTTGNRKLSNDGTFTMRFGFRTVQLMQPQLPGGRAFFFSVNDVPIVIKGSNWIPADSFESRLDTSRLKPLFIALKESHQNMIRNWGGGIYQRDAYYDLADEYGILIWHDAMFACAKYAVPPEFLDSTAKEIIDQIRRIQHHPSIAIWAGNNENEEDLNAGTEAYAKPYSDLYFRTVLQNISTIDTTRPMTGSSPSNGNETADAPFCVDHQSQFYGDTHCYLYTTDNWDVTLYWKPRFMSEFGLQSWPSARTMKKYVPKDQQFWQAEIMSNRNHHGDGQSQIEEQVERNYRAPRMKKNDYIGWKHWLYMSQVNQAYGYKKEVEHFRRLRTQCTEAIPGCTMGMMYWQTNDIWPGASWSAIDYNLNYKMVQYFTKKFYAPMLISPLYMDKSTFETWMVNDDLALQINDGKVIFKMYSFNQHGSHALGSWQTAFSSKKQSATKVFSSTYDEMLKNGNCKSETENNCFLVVEAYDNNDKLLSDNYLYLSKFQNLSTIPCVKGASTCTNIQTKNVRGIVDESNNVYAYAIDIEVDLPSPFTWLEMDVDGHFDDNGMLVVESKTIIFYPNNPSDVNVEIIKNGIDAWSLFDTSDGY